MYAPRVFVSMVGTLAVFAIATYFLSHSLTTALVETVICAVLLQVGYFAGILFLVRKAEKARRSALTDSNVILGAAPTRNDDKVVGIPAGTLNRSEPFKH
ncbi:exopolysaccharide production repressor protein [Rhizobium tubonense]|jgi:exopolysaccharide production repressor protein|uniref:Exopolysaccharide production repressor exox n=1 Tax=Rhizobium tubonense TaxID=484088 RepID=A0A2W4CZ73_9HYPH|nr:exopolysaccharide production repressor protein [Rhizobium tubonense]PZM10594.1 exopolysaccharide production repressor exox [Rhizobium tubonense]